MSVAAGRSEDGTAEDRADAVIRTDGLTKRYGTRAAVHDLSLTVYGNEVYGLLGPNGAGKTTTQRMLVGLIRPSSGSAQILGAAPGDSDALRQVGALIEEPAMYPYLSGRANLRTLAHYTGAPVRRIDGVLDRVGLAGRADDAVKTYSQGMRQRLGVAAALLKDPQLLLLDEPTNGLDPQSMAQMRRLIAELGADGRAVVLSSHLLTEVEQVCDRAGVIHEGELIAEGPVEQLRGSATLRVVAEPVDRAVAVLDAMPGVEAVEVDGARLVVSAPDVAPSDVNAALVGEGVAVSALTAEQRSLEDVFLSLTGDQEVA